MDSFVFNNFKEKILNGEVTYSDKWHAWPVNSKFIDENEDLKYYRSSADFKSCNSAYTKWSDYQTTMYKVNYTYFPMVETDRSSMPEYVDANSFEQFIINYNTNNTGTRLQTHLSGLFFDPQGEFYRVDHIEDVYNEVGIKTGEKEIPKGFYFVRTSEELKWCAEQVNGNRDNYKGMNYNNTINIVLGDNIGIDVTSAEHSLENNKVISYSIGRYIERPFEGIFYGNGFQIKNVTIECNNNNNGIIGNLGVSGLIHTIEINGNNLLKCNKKISLEHLKYEGTDIAAGLLCGKNNGKIKNIKFNGNVYYKDFYPKIYSINSKTDISGLTNDYANNSKDKNQFYPDYLCFNSIGNIIPYIGYFNEGAFATYSSYNQGYWNTECNEYSIKILDNNTNTISPCDEFYNFYITDQSGNNILYNTPETARINVLYYDSEIIKLNNQLIDGRKTLEPISSNGFLCYNPDLDLPATEIARNATHQFKNITAAQYFNKSIKMSQNNRQAYYISPVVGINNSDIEKANINVNMIASGTFVGFMGGLAGKYNEGVITDVVVNLSADETRITKEDTTYGEAFYLRNYFNNAEEVKEDNTLAYYFKERSINNIGALFGVYVASNHLHYGLNYNNLANWNYNINNTSGYLYNRHLIPFKQNEDGIQAYNDDYTFMNRYGAIAAIVELNSCNISDTWSIDTYNNNAYKFGYFKNCSFGYSEDSGDTYLISPYYAAFANEYKAPYKAYNFMLGTVSPLYAEIKPTYLSIPSIISSPFGNMSYKPNSEYKNELTAANREIITINYPDANTARIGLFTIDQNFAAPMSDPNFWSINTEIDLPGVINTYDQPICNSFYADTNSPNFDLNILNLSYKIFGFDNTTIVDTFNYGNSIFNTVLVPGNAYIFNHNEITANNNSNYSATKYISTYPYFGSDIILINNEPRTADKNNNIITDYATYRENNEISSPLKQFKSLNVFYDITQNGENKYFPEGSYLEIKYSADGGITQSELNNLDSAYKINDYICISAINDDQGHKQFITPSIYVNNVSMSSRTDSILSSCIYPVVFADSMINPDGLSSKPNMDTLYIMFPLTSGTQVSESPNPKKLNSLINGEVFYLYTPVLYYQSAIFIPLYDKTKWNPNGYITCEMRTYVQISAMDIPDAANPDDKIMTVYGWDPGFNNNNIDNYNFYAKPAYVKYELDENDEQEIKPVPPTPWYNLGFSGKFKNHLFQSNSPTELLSGLNFTERIQRFNDINIPEFTASAGSELYMQLAKNREIANDNNKSTDERLKDYFKYSYNKYINDTNNIAASGINIDVRYQYLNGKAGFWFIDSNTSKDYNDNITYRGNVLSIGTTINQHCLMNKHLTKTAVSSYTLTSISADDFEGLYITDSKNEPVMYIDVGLGECTEGTSWTFSSYPSNDNSALTAKGLLMELD